jgi:hypothetical protein
MRSIIKDVMTNVEVVDKETKDVLFSGHNVFTDLGKKFLRDAMANVIVLDVSQGYAIELGNPLVPVTAPSYLDHNIQVPLSPALSIALSFVSAVNLSVSSFETLMFFEYTNSTISAIDFRELGLFYRPGSTGGVPASDDSADTYPVNNVLLARLRTTYNKVTIGVNRSVEITWKILF